MATKRLYSPVATRMRSLRILELLAEGKTATVIAREIGLSEGHVNDVLRRLRIEFEVPNAPALVAKALREGVIE